MPLSDLSSRRCQALDGQAAMAEPEIARHLQSAPGWSLVAGAIQKHYEFTDFHRTMAFVNALAWVAHVEDHHPELQLSFKRCTVRFNTHSVAGVSINDFICAAKVDALLP